MDQPSFAIVVSTTRLVEHFSEDSLNEFKTCLFKQLNCQNEQEFLIKVLRQLYKTMDVDSLHQLKSKTIEISQKQKSINNSINTSVLDAVEESCNDKLSQLPSNTIDYMGSFLPKMDSIHFGYLNRHLYIETQKQSYLLKRLNDKLILYDNSFDVLVLPQNNAFHFSIPSQLSIQAKQASDHPNFKMWQQAVLRSKWFKSLFCRLSLFYCGNYDFFEHIPIKSLFGSNNYFTYNNYSRDTIDHFQIGYDGGGYLPINKTFDGIEKLINNFDEFVAKDCNGTKNSENIRMINKFVIAIRNAKSTAVETGTDWDVIRSLLVTFGGIYKSFEVNCGSFSIDTIEEFSQIFHSKLESFKLGRDTQIAFNIDDDDDNDDLNDDVVAIDKKLDEKNGSVKNGENKKDIANVDTVETDKNGKDSKDGKDRKDAENSNIIISNKIKSVSHSAQNVAMIEEISRRAKNLKHIGISTNGVGMGSPARAQFFSFGNINFGGDRDDEDGDNNGKDAPIIIMFNWLDKFNMRHNIESYGIKYQAPRNVFGWQLDDFSVRFMGMGQENVNDNLAQRCGPDFYLTKVEKKIFDKIFIQDYQIHPLLTRIQITIVQESCLLRNLAALFFYLMEIKDELMYNKENCIKTIEIEWEPMYSDSRTGFRSAPSEINSMFGYSSNEDYDDKCNLIEWNDCDFSEKSFGIMYQNVIKWFENVFNKYCSANRNEENKDLIPIPLRQRVLKIVNIEKQ